MTKMMKKSEQEQESRKAVRKIVKKDRKIVKKDTQKAVKKDDWKSQKVRPKTA